MRKSLLPGLLAGITSVATASPALTETEVRWLRAGAPVVAYARAAGLPLDIVVQPQASAGLAPLAMGYADGRCKLVLSMRGNPAAEATLAGTDAAAAPLFIEAMFAHEIGHCWRYAQGAWHGLPAGFVLDDSAGPLDAGTRRAWQTMRATRREEGFADLVALAWVQQHHPARYGEVHRWISGVRADQPVPGSHHDTRAWLRLAHDSGAFAPGATPFERAMAPWQQGLLADD